MDLRFAPADPAAPPAADLIERMVVEVGALYGGRIDREGLPKAGPAELSPPGGGCLVGWLDGEPVAVGGVKDLGGGAAEIKRMYVVPEARGRGVARALLAALEDLARSLGHHVARLDTGEHQPGARRLYEAAGYAAVGNFNANPVAAWWGEKRLG
jgi:GNAT superfamily N-acetyltransferase